MPKKKPRRKRRWHGAAVRHLARTVQLLYESRMRFSQITTTLKRAPAKLFCLLLCGYLLVLSPLHVFAGSRAPDNYPVAMRSFGVWEPLTDERFDFSVWYPGGSNTTPTPSDKEGWVVDYSKRGKITPGFYPVVLVSHDTASSRYANNDLAVALAARGFVVIVPAHDGDNQNNSEDIYTAELLRNRPRQLLRALETVLESPDFSYFVDESRIGLIGIGFGSISVLQLAGAKPDLSRLSGYCAQNHDEGDAFCAPWALERFSRAARAMPNLERVEGRDVFTPPLTLYAPELVPAIIPDEVLQAFFALTEPQEGKRTKSFWQKIFGVEKGDEAPAAKNEATAASAAENATAAANGDTEASPSSAQAVEQFPLELDFQGGRFFGGTDSGSPFVYIAMPESQEFRAGVGEIPSSVIASPEQNPVKPDASTVFRRPGTVRQIRGIALVAPAGGMLFTPESLQPVRMPVAMIEAGKDSLYPPEMHAQPYYAWLPAPPLVLRLASSNHFALFALCSKESMANLGELCGNLSGEERDKVALQRNHFLLNFFQSSLGMPLTPVRPPGYAPVPTGE